VSIPALSTQGLDKRFGSLVVASDINLVIPHGVRYALIGPNGAGKTTLINLMTGMLRPDAGKILLGDADITAFRPDARVKRGLVRTFQINALFPHLNALDAVTLAVCERRGVAGEWWRPLQAHADAVEEAYGILGSLMLGADCYRLTRELAYGQQRLLEIALALATQPKVLLLDEPAAGVPRDEVVTRDQLVARVLPVRAVDRGRLVGGVDRAHVSARRESSPAGTVLGGAGWSTAEHRVGRLRPHRSDGGRCRVAGVRR
jgi:branched-chain amino acid transport system ATP-binding protein